MEIGLKGLTKSTKIGGETYRARKVLFLLDQEFEQSWPTVTLFSITHICKHTFFEDCRSKSHILPDFVHCRVDWLLRFGPKRMNNFLFLF